MHLTASCTNSAVIISKAVSSEDCFPENTECILEYSKCVPLPYKEVSIPQESSLTSGLHQQTRAKSVCPATTTCYLTMSGSHGCCPQHAKLKP
ncbi:hypothetical protein AALO_G00282660 [Alosa alosa]|uniref:Uncharacterized protein n=1 Tax=Alosa alosa TaxID=278164 RepID=A0AAV6FPT2_9TELE|nr:hypothetical protein AALO_G00282660 [Alosa alosa]